MDYPIFKNGLSYLQNIDYLKTLRRVLHIAQPHIVLTMTYTGPGEAKQSWSDLLMYKCVNDALQA